MADLSPGSTRSYEMLPSESVHRHLRHYQSLHQTTRDSSSTTETICLGIPGIGDPGMLCADAYSTQSFHSTFNPSQFIRPLIDDAASGLLKPQTCVLRDDDTGAWNFFIAWYIFLLHVCACAALFTSIIYIEGQEFLIGSGRYFDSPLHQAQVTGLVSLALVIIRVIAGCCSSLLVWRVAYILLEKSSMTLAELTRLTGQRIPLLPGRSRRDSPLWVLCASIAILLLWPPAFAAPFASSSISWTPGKRVQEGIESALVSKVGDNTNWADINNPTLRMLNILDSATEYSKDPKHFFGTSHISSQRYFTATEIIPSDSRINLRAPYFDVNVEWVDSSHYREFENAYNMDDLYVLPTFLQTYEGATALIRKSPWNAEYVMPNTTTIFKGAKLFTVVLEQTTYNRTLMVEGTKVGNKTGCSTKSPYFGVLPNVEIAQEEIAAAGSFDNSTKTPEGYLCTIGGIATITAGVFEAEDCLVSSPPGNQYATCITGAENTDLVETDWLTGLALDFMNDVLVYTILLNVTGPWISDDITKYAEGTLKMGYNAAWNGLQKWLENDTESVTFRPSEQIVSAAVERSKLYIWLGMNAGVTISCVVVLWMQRGSRVKTIRDTNLAALTMDLTEISHSDCTSGLCNAVALNQTDRRLPKMRWATDLALPGYRGSGGGYECRRKVVFCREGAAKDIGGTPLTAVHPDKDSFR